MTMRIRERSSALDGALTRCFRDESADVFAAAFAFSMENGGEDEIGFSRLEGVSFNPRGARVVLILLGDLLVADKQLVRVALLAAGRPEGWGEATERELALRAQRAFVSAESFLGEQIHGVQVVAVSLFLDFLRHSHQVRDTSPGSDGSTLMTHAFDNAHVYERWAEVHGPDVAKKIQMWRERNGR